MLVPIWRGPAKRDYGSAPPSSAERPSGRRELSHPGAANRTHCGLQCQAPGDQAAASGSPASSRQGRTDRGRQLVPAGEQQRSGCKNPAVASPPPGSLAGQRLEGYLNSAEDTNSQKVVADPLVQRPWPEPVPGYLADATKFVAEFMVNGAACRNRTDDLPLTRRLLYQLS
jgi:hypothetical protein